MKKSRFEQQKHIAIMAYVIVAAVASLLEPEGVWAFLAQDSERFVREVAGVRGVAPVLEHQIGPAILASADAHGSQDDAPTPHGQEPLPLFSIALAGACLSPQRRRALAAKEDGWLRVEPIDILWTCADSEGSPEGKWVQIAFEGTWKGHPQGEFSFTQAIFEQMIANFTAAGRDFVVDYNHATSIPGAEAPASGWIKALRPGQTERKKASLEAFIEWTEDAAEAIRKKKQRYLSPAFSLDAVDKRSGQRIGARLGHVALTNAPFIDQLPAVSASEAVGLNHKERQMEEHLKRIAELLGLSEEASAEDVAKKVGELVELAEKGKQLGLALGEINEALELGEAAESKKALSAIMRLKNPATSGSLEELRELRAKMATREATEAVSAAMGEGKVTAAGTDQHKWALAYALKDPAGFGEWAASAPVLVPLRPIERSKKGSAGSLELTEYQARLCRELGITKEQYVEELKAEDDRPRRTA